MPLLCFKESLLFSFVSDTLTLPESFFLPIVRSDQSFCHSRRKSEEKTTPSLRKETESQKQILSRECTSRSESFDKKQDFQDP